MDIQFIRDYCLSLKGTSEDVKWGNDLCMLVAGKMFCVCALEGPFRVSFKVSPEEFGELSVTDGIIPAPYMARNKWIQVQQPDIFSRQEWENYLINSYHLVSEKLPVKIKRELGLV